MYLTVVDKENYVLDGVVFEIPQYSSTREDVKVVLDEASIYNAVARYKGFVAQGLAFGKIDRGIPEDYSDEISADEYNVIASLNPYEAMKLVLNEQTPMEDMEEKMPYERAAFQVIDFDYDSANKTLVARFYVLDTPEGLEMKQYIDQGRRCLLTKFQIEFVEDKDNRTHDEFGRELLLFISRLKMIKGGWRVSFEGDDNVERGQVVQNFNYNAF